MDDMLSICRGKKKKTYKGPNMVKKQIIVCAASLNTSQYYFTFKDIMLSIMDADFPMV